MHMHADTHTHACMHESTQTHTRMHTNTNTHTHTQTCTQGLSLLCWQIIGDKFGKKMLEL